MVQASRLLNNADEAPDSRGRKRQRGGRFLPPRCYWFVLLARCRADSYQHVFRAPTKGYFNGPQGDLHYHNPIVDQIEFRAKRFVVQNQANHAVVTALRFGALLGRPTDPYSGNRPPAPQGKGE